MLSTQKHMRYGYSRVIDNMKYCCEEFLREATEIPPSTLFDETCHPKFIISGSGDGWNIWGCCGHCYVVMGMKFCPFCGSKLPDTLQCDTNEVKE